MKTKCIQCRIHETRRDDSICYRCNDNLENDLLLKAVAPPHPIRFPLPPDTKLACMEKPDLFFGQGKVRVEARELCNACPAYDWCLTWATANDEEGVWAGMKKDERRRHAAAKLTQASVTLVA